MIKYLLIFILLFSQTAFAYKEPIANALYYYLEKQGRAEGAKINTGCSGEDYYITHWEVDDIRQPTEQELGAIVADYKASPASKTTEQRISELENKVKLLER